MRLKHVVANETVIDLTIDIGRAVAQRLDAGFPPRRLGFAYG
jgi:hypothetical protein